MGVRAGVGTRDEGRGDGVFAGEPLFQEKERFPRAPSRESRIKWIRPAARRERRGVAYRSINRQRKPICAIRLSEGGVDGVAYRAINGQKKPTRRPLWATGRALCKVSFPGERGGPGGENPSF